MSEIFVCSCCGQEYPICDCFDVGNRTFCPDCLDEETLVCTHCEDRILNHQNAGDKESPLCQHCFDNHYLNCDRCCSLLHRDDAHYLTSGSEEPFCYDCYCQENRESAIHDYNYKPEPLFYGDGDRYFGIELEIDGGGERSAPAEEILSIANKNDELIYCKHDGSLKNGFEIVTHPMTLGFHCNVMPWQALLQKARSLGYTSHQANTCGLHLHVSRLVLGLDVYQQDGVIARILYFFEKNWHELLKFSRRTAYQLNRCAARYGHKKPIAAHKMRFRIPTSCKVVMGHTRLATQGSQKYLPNNHPFLGQIENLSFTLAHNGVLHNDVELRKTLHFPNTRIQTDSYIAVQLIEQQKALNFESLKYMAEQVRGSFCFTVMDHLEQLYFVKGDNPLCLYHFPKMGLYLYASTEEILRKAYRKMHGLTEAPVSIKVSSGDILCVAPDGTITWSKFDEAIYLWLCQSIDRTAKLRASVRPITLLWCGCDL